MIESLYTFVEVGTDESVTIWGDTNELVESVYANIVLSYAVPSWFFNVYVIGQKLILYKNILKM